MMKSYCHHPSQIPEKTDTIHRIRVGWLIDGGGGPIKKDQKLTAENGRIRSIEPFDPSVCDVKDVTDLSHATVLPTLVDAHVHLAFSGTLDSEQRRLQLQQSYSEVENAVHQHVETCVENGVVAVRDAGDRHGWVNKSRPIDKWPFHICATSWAWHAPGRYGRMIGQAPAKHESLLKAVQRGSENIDHIKILQSGINSLKHFGYETPPQFTLSEIISVRQYAHQKKIAVMVHANGVKPVHIALEAQCDSIEHGYFMGNDNLHRMADQQVFWVPTMIPMAALTLPEVIRSSMQNSIALRTLEHQMAQVLKAYEIGVPIVLGTDAGSLGVNHGIAVRQELALLIKAGLSVNRAVQCATQNAALLMGLKNRGVIRPGARADFIVIPGRPEKIESGLEKIESIFREGIPYF